MHRIVLGGVIVAVLGTVAVERVTRADSIDCKGLKKWNFDTTYKKGDQVYIHGPSFDFKWECTAATCQKDFPDTATGLKSWKDLGSCSARVE